MARYILTLAVLLLLVFPAAALSGADAVNPCENSTESQDKVLLAEAQPGEAREMEYGHDDGGELPDFLPPQHLVMRPGLSTYFGYRFVGLDESRRAAEYDFLHPSVAGGLSLHYYTRPHRFDVDFDYLNESDHDAEGGYAYKNIFKLDFRSMELFHNMDHYRFINAGFTDLNPGKDDFGVSVNDNEVTLELKHPGKAARLYVNIREFRKDGTIQQRWQPSFRGDGITSVARDIDWTTQELTAGINENIFKALEFDYHFTIKAFDSDLRSVLGPDLYTTPADVILKHNQVSDLETRMHTISVHTDQCWPLSLSTRFTWGEKENKDSGAEVDLNRQYGDITYKATDNLLIALKYGRQQLQVENPETVRFVDFAVGPTTVVVSRDSISTVRDKGMLFVRYYPVPDLSLLAQYELDAVDRKNAESWDRIEEELLTTRSHSVTHTGTVNANYRINRHTRVRAGVSYSHNADPSYNVDYEDVVKAHLHATWVPSPGLTVDGQYNVLRGTNSGRTPNTNFEPVDEFNREVEQDHAGAGITWLTTSALSCGARYDYLRNRLEQTVFYEDGGGNPVYAFNTPYWDTSHAYTLFANYCFSFPLELHLDFTQSWSRGMYRLADPLTGPTAVPVPTVNLDVLTDQKIRDTRGTFRADYEIYWGFGLSAQYGISQFSDLEDKQVTGNRDGTAHFGTILLTKVW